MLHSLWTHGLQHARVLCLSLSLEFAQFMSIELMMLSNHLILFCPLPFLLSIFTSVRVFSSEYCYLQWETYVFLGLIQLPTTQLESLVSIWRKQAMANLTEPSQEGAERHGDVCHSENTFSSFVPTLVFLPGESHWLGSLVGYSPWGHRESDMTEWLSTHSPVLYRKKFCIIVLWLPWDFHCFSLAFIKRTLENIFEKVELWPFKEPVTWHNYYSDSKLFLKIQLQNIEDMILSLLKHVPSKIWEIIFQVISTIISEQWNYGWYLFAFICIFIYPKLKKMKIYY